MSKKPTSFLLYNDLETPFNFLSLEDRGRLITYIFQYVRLGEVDLSEASDLVGLAFSMIKVYLDRDREQYEEKCRINAENGKKGGRPRKNGDIDEISDQAETEGLPTDAKKAYNNNNNNYNNKYNNNNDFNYNNKFGCGGNRGGAYDAKEKKKEKFGEGDHSESSFDPDVFFAAALKRSYENI